MDDLLCFSLDFGATSGRSSTSSVKKSSTRKLRNVPSEFGRTELGFLGHRVSAARVAVDPHKIAAA